MSLLKKVIKKTKGVATQVVTRTPQYQIGKFVFNKAAKPVVKQVIKPVRKKVVAAVKQNPRNPKMTVGVPGVVGIKVPLMKVPFFNNQVRSGINKQVDAELKKLGMPVTEANRQLALDYYMQQQQLKREHKARKGKGRGR